MIEIVAGWEPREALGYELAYFSAIRRTSQPIPPPKRLMEKKLRYDGLYKRPHERRGDQLWDVISDAPMSTEFANTRFLTPWVSTQQWPLFCDFADMLFVSDPAKLFALADDRYAVQVVKRRHEPTEAMKMDGQIQTAYPRKNWSSVILWNLQHPGNARLTLEMVNSLPGRDLHAFCWLEEDEIGELPAEWNYLVGVDDLTIKPSLLHFTRGLPIMPGYEDGPWSDVWKQELTIMDASRPSIGAASKARLGTDL